jgi:hypothetical protein
VPPTPDGVCNPLLGAGAIETHGGYMHGDGHKTVNSDGGDGMFSPNLPPPLDPSYLTGTACPGVFASEFGSSSMSAFEAMAATISPPFRGIHADPVMYQRNYGESTCAAACRVGRSWPFEHECET